jgi:hypothetical protein
MTERLTLPDGQWADLKTRLNHGDARRIQAVMFAAIARPDATIEGLMASGQAEVALLETYAKVFTVNWNVTDGDGRSLPLEDASWDELPEETYAAITRRAQELWMAWREAVKSPLEEPLGDEPPSGESNVPSKPTTKSSRRG